MIKSETKSFNYIEQGINAVDTVLRPYGLSDADFVNKSKFLDRNIERSEFLLLELASKDLDVSVLFLGFLDYTSGSWTRNLSFLEHRKRAEDFGFWDRMFTEFAETEETNQQSASGSRNTKYEIDDYLSDQLIWGMKSWDEGSVLSSVRERMGLISQEQERDFQVFVLDVKGEQLLADDGCSAYIEKGSEVPTIYLPNNYMDYGLGLLEHEYAHSQGGVASKLDHRLFSWLDEALTENFTSDPSSYPKARNLYRELLIYMPSAVGLLHKMYTANDQVAKKEFISELVKKIGLSGYFQLARANPFSSIDKAAKFHGDKARNIYLPNLRIDSLLRVSPYTLQTYEPRGFSMLNI